MIRTDAIWMSIVPIDMHAGADTLLARILLVYGKARLHGNPPDVSMTLGFIPVQDRDFFVAEVAELTDKWKTLEVAALKIRIQST